MHICMVSTGYLPIIPNRVGAIEPYIYELSRSLSDTNTVDIFGIGRGTEKVGNLNVQTFGYGKNFPRLLEAPLGHRLAFQVPFNVYLFKRFSDINKKSHVDILHIHDANSGFAASAISEIFHTPYVCSIHNEIKSAVSIKKCTRVLAVSNYIRDFLIKKRGLKESQVAVLNIAIDTNFCKRKKTRVEAKNELGLGNHNIILFVGRKCPEKGPQILLEALPRIIKSNPKVIAILVGPDYMFRNNSDFYTQLLKKTAKNLGIEKNVHFVSFVSESKLELFYQAADVLVFPSTWQEPFGKVILEAMSYETPVIASTVGGVPEIILNEKNGLLVPSGDPSALAAKTNYLLSNPKVAKMLSDEGKKTVLEKYTFSQVSSRCREIYNEIT